MTEKRLVRTAVILAAAILLASMLVYNPAAAYAASLAARMDRFTNPDGTDYFALSLKPEGIAPAEGPRDVLVMFNTSAGQTGEYREKALKVLQDFLAGMPAGDRVQLMAVDLDANRLNKGFVDPKGKEMTDALAQLKTRDPLGACDMKKALAAAAGGFDAEAKNPRTVIYIGDGRSAAKFLAAQEAEELINKLADNRISVDSYLIGLRPDMQIVGALAGQTGGVVIADGADLSSQQAAAALKTAARAPVLWPQLVAWPEEIKEAFPKQRRPCGSIATA